MGRGEDGAETTSSRHVPLPATRWDGGPAGVDSHRLSVAPMLDCTDSHFRRLCRLLSKRTHLWSEMVNQDAVLYAHKTRPALLSHGTEEHPVTCQLGGASPSRLALASEIVVDEYGYDEVNLNCGCPSAKVVNKPDADKRFGAALMKDAELVGECLRRMKEAVDVPVTLKHRLGVRSGSGGLHDARGYDKESDTDGYHFVSNFVDTVHELSGVEHFIAHARCAVLGGLSTTGNRMIPPLRHEEVHQLALDFPKLGFSLNGGVETVDDALSHLRRGTVRGVMLGRAVYKNPAVLATVDRLIYGDCDGDRKERMAGEHEQLTVAAWPTDGWRVDDRWRERRSYFSLHDDGAADAAACVTRERVLRRFAGYGDAVLRQRVGELEKHPKALGEARGLCKALGGMSYGVRAGNRFKRDLEFGLQGWTKRLLAGEDAGGLSFSGLITSCVAGLGEQGVEDMRKDMENVLESEQRRRSLARGRKGGEDGNDGDDETLDAETCAAEY